MMGMLCHLPLQISPQSCAVMQKTSLPHGALMLHCPYFCNCWIKPTSTLYQPTPNMSKEEADPKAMTKKASQVLRDHPTNKEPDGTEFLKALN